eukprot:TRINITY_DN6023_c0_g1_i2.p1 TRINITY_DN6023_c0_g1~~TRINITY_DN6023_c0_g1_i2.p1  ORF type:complete len:533 (+),score=113.78 TRINITY_DN6023_c0_g1_i2:83-1681(+)
MARNRQVLTERKGQRKKKNTIIIEYTWTNGLIAVAVVGLLAFFVQQVVQAKSIVITDAQRFDRCLRLMDDDFDMFDQIQHTWKCFRKHPLPHGRFLIGRGYFNTMQYDKAQELFATALREVDQYSKNHPEYQGNSVRADIYHYMALCYVKQNNPISATNTWAKALRFKKHDPEIRFSYATCLLSQGINQLAADQLTAALKLKPKERFKYQYLLSLAQKRVDQPRDAALNAALASKGTFDMLMLGIYATEVGEWEDAKLLLTRHLAKIDANPTEVSLIATKRRTINHLLDVYKMLGDSEASRLLTLQALKEKVIQHPNQRPTWLYGNLLPATPFPQHAVLDDVIAELEELYEPLKADLNSMEWSKTVDLVRHDSEQLAVSGNWTQAVLVRDGTVLEYAFGPFVQSQQRLARLLYKYAHDLPRGCLEVSVLAPGTHIKPHFGPTNHRVRLHLGLDVPESGAVLLVDDNPVHWANGKAFAFDDSFIHEVWNNSTQPRTVLIFDVWHPLINESDRPHFRRHQQWRKFDTKERTKFH